MAALTRGTLQHHVSGEGALGRRGVGRGSPRGAGSKVGSISPRDGGASGLAGKRGVQRDGGRTEGRCSSEGSFSPSRGRLGGTRPWNSTTSMADSRWKPDSVKAEEREGLESVKDGSEKDGKETLGSERYLRICRRMVVLPEPLLLRTLRAPLEHGGSYSTARAEVSLTAEAVRSIVAALDYAKGLHTIRLVGLRKGSASLLTREVMSSLLRAVTSSPMVTELDMSDNALDDSIAAQNLQSMLSKNNSIASLILAHNNLGESSGRHILSALNGNRVLRFLDVTCNPVLSEWPMIGSYVEKLLKTNQALTGLSWSMSSTGAFDVLTAMLQLPPARLRTLGLTHNRLMPPVVDHLCALLDKRNVGMTDLDLTHSYIGDRGAKTLARALEQNRSLVRLVLAHNRLSCDGAVDLARSLRLNNTLTQTSLASNLISDVGAVALASCLTSNAVLTSLDLSRNSMSSVGGNALRQALHSNKAVVDLGTLTSFAFGIGLRSSLEWHLRANDGKANAAAATAAGERTHRDALLQLLPTQERKFRGDIFLLEDELARAAISQAEKSAESSQVLQLLEETVVRNSELVSTVTALQKKVARMKARSKKKKKKYPVWPAVVSASAIKSAKDLLEEEEDFDADDE